MSTDRQPAPETPVPTCYRHPGREAHLRCTRCDRYICPDCMRDAAVGHQCPECVAEGNRGVRRPRPAMPGRGRSDQPVVTYALIAVCVLAYLGEIASKRVVPDFMMLGALVRTDGALVAGVLDGEWYRLVTSMFLHQEPDGGSFGFAHILLNMWALYVLGPPLEVALGRARFLSLYLLSGLGGNVLLLLLAPYTGAVGASGAIFGLFGAFFVVARRSGAPTGPILFLLAINLIFTFSVSGISWQGHVGGLVTGLAVAFVYAYAPAVRRRWLHIAAPIAVLVLFVALVVAKAATFTPDISNGLA
ncbi:rhomboid family intramembrane serine protease [Actinomadura logoneensis]|uniref:Rhomboid family intramembrane serine protease n=1 Tax=Actinomadura logoneensis TaxID=2293572 RepID=A0A372JQP5_9ACTN|nr:rhomboid family intramembrane serine protease [Actinomadura logoneensis]RFU42126.1 rhomboid family intramembrane serine protease [Actinomadura logoneensis]